jgi:hypothetical protein
MSDGREERKEQEERRRWEEKKDPGDDRDRDWERDGQRERRDSRAVELDARVRAESGRSQYLMNRLCGLREGVTTIHE